MSNMLFKGAIVKSGGQGDSEELYVLISAKEQRWHRLGKSASEGYVAYWQIPNPELVFRGVEDWG